LAQSAPIHPTFASEVDLTFANGSRMLESDH